jgi:hypothetical protein
LLPGLRGFLFASWLCAVGVGPAFAQESDAERTALARSLFREGVELGEEGRFEEAADRYRRVLEIRPTPQVRYNLAHALAELGRAVEPAELAHQILRDPESPERVRVEARALLDRVEPLVARLTVRLDGPREGVEVTIDGDELPPAAIGIAAPADPGRHRIAAARDGSEVDSREVTLAEGGEGEVTLEVPPLPPRPEAEEAAPLRIRTEETERDEDERPSRWWLWTILSLAVAGGATAAAVVLLSRDDPLRGNLMPGRISF